MNQEPDKQPRVQIIPPAGRPAQPPQPPARRAPAPSPWRGRLAWIPGLPTLLGLWAFMLDDQAPTKHRLAVLATFLYFVWPHDLLMDFVLGPVGYVDDMAVVVGLITFLGSSQLEPYRKLAKLWLKGQVAHLDMDLVRPGQDNRHQ